MQTPLRIAFRHADRSPALEARVRELMTRLERFHDHITGCQVIVEGPHAHLTKGGAFRVRISVTVPGGEINADSNDPADGRHADVYVALRDAFDNVKRQLREFEREY